ncbi:hypothetical protein NC651_011524 [Populus alba x Populus x berolinensis]|nr:hypothetical protein NC651_011524 [Populus alba x Populus x berolinensis]
MKQVDMVHSRQCLLFCLYFSFSLILSILLPFFLFWIVLSLSLSLSISILYFFLFFVCVSFLIRCSKGESRGGWYTWRQSWCLCVGWPVLSSLYFYFSFAYSPIFLPWVFFFCPFVLLCLFVLPFAFCVYRSLPVFCAPLCVCPLFLFLFVLYLSPGSFLFSFPLFSFFVRASVMASIVGARRMLP